MSIPILDQKGDLSQRVLHQRIDEEPYHRISKAQRESLLQIAEKDPNARIEGMDWKFRPVVLTKASGPARHTHYALLKNGDATPVTWANNRSKRLAETWR